MSDVSAWFHIRLLRWHKAVANTTADPNGDGHLDLLIASFGHNSVSVLLGDGHGGFTRPPRSR